MFNFLIGGSDIGDALIRHDGIDGVTFTGSHRVGMHILRTQVARDVPRPCIAEMGGKNAVVVSAQADLDVAAQGIVRSAFGMSGQKCSALSRIYVAEPVADALIERIRARHGRDRDRPPARRGHVRSGRSPRRRPTSDTNAMRRN